VRRRGSTAQLQRSCLRLGSRSHVTWHGRAFVAGVYRGGWKRLGFVEVVNEMRKRMSRARDYEVGLGFWVSYGLRAPKGLSSVLI
jgi:hypothetical protein